MSGRAELTLKFAYVCVCFMISLVSYRYREKKRDCLFLIAGMAITVVSDFFLVYRDRDYAGFYIFGLAHAAYILRASRNAKKSAAMIVSTYAAGVPLYFTLDPLFATALVYACLFIEDIVTNIYNYRRGIDFPLINRRLTLAGISAFFICDVNVLIFNLPRYVSFPERVSRAAFTAMWVFYLASQLLLSVSGFKYKTKGRV